MHKTFKYLLIFVSMIGVFLILIFMFVKLQVVNNCLFISNGDISSIVVSDKIHRMINTNDIKYCYLELKENKYKSWLTFKDEENNNFSYWLSVDSPFAFNNQTTNVNLEFGKLPIYKYIDYMVL
jgi:hypothetical protein